MNERQSGRGICLSLFCVFFFPFFLSSRLLHMISSSSCKCSELNFLRLLYFLRMLAAWKPLVCFRMESVGGTLDKHETNIGGLESSVRDMETHIQQWMEATGNAVDSLESRVTTLEAKVESR